MPLLLMCGQFGIIKVIFSYFFYFFFFILPTCIIGWSWKILVQLSCSTISHFPLATGSSSLDRIFLLPQFLIYITLVMSDQVYQPQYQLMSVAESMLWYTVHHWNSPLSCKIYNSVSLFFLACQVGCVFSELEATDSSTTSFETKQATLGVGQPTRCGGIGNPSSHTALCPHSYFILELV